MEENKDRTKSDFDEELDIDPEVVTVDAEKVVITAGGEGNLFAVFDRLPVAEQIKLALGGNRPARQLVLRKGPAIMKRYLIKNPKISEQEIADIASIRSTTRDVLERIAKNKEWMKVEAIRLNLVKHPNTPVPLALRAIPFLKKRDLSRLLKSKSVPPPIEAAIRRILYARGTS